MRWELAPHLKGRLLSGAHPTDQVHHVGSSAPGHLVTDQPIQGAPSLVTPRLTKLTDQQRRIIELCEVPRSQADLITPTGTPM